MNTSRPTRSPLQGSSGSGSPRHGDEREDAIAGHAEAVPLGVGSSDDCAGAAVFLASALSNFVTGSTVHVNGGTLAAAGLAPQPGGPLDDVT